ncbi:hypothetical protein FISHEDRAFT_73585 [Fistulina hepatica ATCC 64428]|uniref:Histone chaperone RTT106/FACT complex subunit SPT16-like middle domain-containing protein n=1 Tax=Fistulina hepatica ATCC 64428 TaxID=1128425 RepID=A0A0D7AD45_9AGAR|nr:hypothetical protein FISHEDRAFT_73585 [Fistulina hepatica ATCC 64428]
MSLSTSKTPIINAIAPLLPNEMASGLAELTTNSPQAVFFETFIRFVTGGDRDASTSISSSVWTQKQGPVINTINSLTRPAKRTRENDDENNEELGTKRARTAHDVQDDKVLFTLHSISATCPIRKKVHILVCENSVRMINPSSKAVEAVISRDSITRSFLLPTRNKTKAHWTVVLLSSDAGKSAAEQVIFGVDAVAASTTKVTEGGDAELPISKGQDMHPILKSFLRHVGAPIHQPTSRVFKSACPTHVGISADAGGIPGVEAYRAAKAGTLWFMEEGVLWGESKPCEFWSVQDLHSRSDGVRLISATGRTCTVIFKRHAAVENDEDADAGEETEFSMVDGREQQSINNWVMQYRDSFGGEKSKGKVGQDRHAARALPSGPITIHQLVAESDSEDDDFTDSDARSGSVVSSLGGSDSDEESGSDGDDGEESAAETDDEIMAQREDEKLDPRHHPLLREGAMPRMSKGLVEAVVAMVENDFDGGPASVSEGEDGMEEVDELDD